MKTLMAMGMLILVILYGNTAFADSHTYYSASSAVSYATTNYNTSYGAGGNPFGDYTNYGGNCTNFASQSIIGGMIGSSSMTSVYNARSEFDIDAGGGSLQWYWINDSNRGPAFTGAHYLFEYARDNLPSWCGLHFQYVTHDTPSEFMDYDLVQVGDLIFADWDADGVKDHTMIVTGIQWWQLGYNEIRVTYQGSPGMVGKTNIGLGDINEYYDYEALFIVYRPVDYNPDGL